MKYIHNRDNVEAGTDISTAHVTRGDIRPLGALSDFVVESLPDCLSEFDTNPGDASVRLADSVSKLLHSHEFKERLAEMSGEPLELQRVALLDLAMMECAMRTRGLAVPNPLLEALDALGEGLHTLPCMTYELIIRSNPESDLRTFTKSNAERFFYTHHEKIEEELSTVLSLLHGKHIEATPYYYLSLAEHHLREVTTIMNLFEANVPQDAFNKFRLYFDGNRGGLKGPSGLRSANLFAAAFAIMGDELMPRRLKVEKEIDHYPVGDRGGLLTSIEMMEQKEDLFARCRREGYPPNLSLVTQRLAEAYLAFLKSHLQVVLGLLPPKASGTGGTEGVPFLERGVERVELALMRFTAERKAATKEHFPDVCE